VASTRVEISIDFESEFSKITNLWAEAITTIDKFGLATIKV